MTTPIDPIREALPVVAWGTTRTLDGKQILDEMCVSTNPAYVKVHNHHAWEELCKVSDAKAEIEALRADAQRYLAFFGAGLPITFLGQEYETKADLDAAIDALKEPS